VFSELCFGSSGLIVSCFWVSVGGFGAAERLDCGWWYRS
jgi:hypothetical protein